MPRRKSKKVTLKDIADLMGMTPATISKALRDGNDISKETRDKVKKIAEEMGYRPNLMARSLVQRRSYMLGVVVPDLRISFFSEVTRGIYERARERGYEAIIMVNDEDPMIEKRNLEFLFDLAVDGILIDAVPGDQNVPVFERLRKAGLPFVAYDRFIDGMETTTVTINDEQAGYNVVEHLVKHGRKNIAFLGPTEKLFVARGRYRGYRRALDEFNLEFSQERVIPCQISKKDAEEKLSRLFENNIPVDAVVCVGGLVAYGGGMAVLKNGREIPDDVALAEFGDNDIVARLGVPFLTVYQKPYEMGTKSVDLLIQDIEDDTPQTKPLHYLIDTELIYHQVGISRFNA